MCIVIISTAHPTYPFILLSNRDEVLARPTARASWWPDPLSFVLAGRDLHHSSHGTWLGITKQGRLAVLTNFREQGVAPAHGTRSRGEISKAYLATPPDSKEEPEAFAKKLVEIEGVQDMDGFSLIFGWLKKRNVGPNGKGHTLGIVSNRTTHAGEVIWVPEGEGERTATFGQTCSLSNSRFGDRAWPKVVKGEELLESVVQDSIQAADSEDQLLEKCFELLSRDTLPRQRPGEPWLEYVVQMRHSIFIPEVGDPERGTPQSNGVKKSTYGTQKQTTILVNTQGKVTFVERTLFDDDAQPVEEGNRDRKYCFQIEGWDE